MIIKFGSGMRVRLVRSRESCQPTTVKRFEATTPGTVDAKRVVTVRDDEKRVVDYLDVSIEGYLSTFQGTTPRDRDGDYVERGAFRDTLHSFMSKNPVMLLDHKPSVESVVGRWVEAVEDNHGLRVVGRLSNAPEVRSVRFKVVEGALRTLSMGGVFHYKSDGRGIWKVDLFEGSLVAVPANPDAVFHVRSLTPDERAAFDRSGAIASLNVST